MDRHTEGERWRVTSAVLHSETPSLGETFPEGEVVEPTEVRMELWTYRLEAVSRFTAPEVDVTVWAAGGTLRTLDNLTGYEVVREGGNAMQYYREVTEPLFGFRRAVRRGDLKPPETANPRPGVYSAAPSNLTVELNAAGLPLRVTTDGATCTFDYSQQLALTDAPVPYRQPQTPPERYVYYSAAQVKFQRKVHLPDQVSGHRRVAVFQRTSPRSPDTLYAVWRSKAGTEIQLVESKPVAEQVPASGITRTRGMVCYHRQNETKFVEFYAPDVQTLRKAVEVLREDLLHDLDAELNR